MIGLRRTISVEGRDYFIYQLPCSDEIEVKHPEGKKYLVCMTPGESEKYKVLTHTNTFPEAELFLISKIKSDYNRDLVRIDIVKHRLFDGSIFDNKNNAIKKPDFK